METIADQKLAGGSSTAAVRNLDWRTNYARRLMITDALVLIWVVFGTQVLWLGLGTEVSLKGPRQLPFLGGVSYAVISFIVVVAWLLALGLYDTRSARVVGIGSEEYSRVVSVSVRLFGVFAIAAFLLKLDIARGYVLIAFPLGTLVLLATRWMWRQWLLAKRSSGTYSSRVLLVGSAATVLQTATELIRRPDAGYVVVGACLPSATRADRLKLPGVPIVGTTDTVTAALERSDADTVVLTGSDDLTNTRVRRISWELEPGKKHLVVAPSIIDVGGPRIHTRPVAGLPLIHVETPTYEGAKLVAKRGFDIFVGGVALIVLSPLLLAITIAVRTTSHGPVLFKQRRIGLNGEVFTMLKFRSMVADAEDRLSQLQSQSHDAGNGVLFKMRDDPRVTRVGRALRRFSLDELPQLFNVMYGSMSMVGPRPSLERELGQYEEHTHRRFLVKPGVTGLWQVSGRSNLSWEESVRLDLFYVENWSITSDLVILWRTFRAVVSKDGAY